MEEMWWYGDEWLVSDAGDSKNARSDRSATFEVTEQEPREGLQKASRV